MSTSPLTPLFSSISVGTFGLVLLACGPSEVPVAPVTSRPGPEVASAARAAAQAPASADAGGPLVVDVAGGCRTDADCRLHSNWCHELPCTCMAHEARARAPSCEPAPKVACFRDPCQRMEPECREGRCAVRAAGPLAQAPSPSSRM